MLTLELCEALEIAMVCSPLAAGDFNKPYVGDSEAMINALVARARRIPWQVLFVLSDFLLKDSKTTKNEKI